MWIMLIFLLLSLIALALFIYLFTGIAAYLRALYKTALRGTVTLN